MKIKQDMCPFNSKGVVIQFWEWVESGEPDGPWWGHLDSVMHISKMEKRKHPPLSKK